LGEDLATETLRAYNNTIEILSEIQVLIESKKGEWKLFGSKKTETVEGKFRFLLESTKNSIESLIWYGKGFAIQLNYGSKVDGAFHELMGLVIMKFNDISMRLDVSKLDDKLIEHLRSQFQILTDYAQRFWNIQGSQISSTREVEILKTIEDFRSRLWDFTRVMEPYLKSEEPKKVV
jgi:hypothetical protein